MNNTNAWLQFALFLGVLLLLTKPLGLYLARVLDVNGKTWLDRAVKPFERLTYRICGIKPEQEQSWIGYAVSVLVFSLTGMLFTYFILRYQHFLPLNPQGMPGLSAHLAFNTAASFTTNTNWQSYGGESTMSYFSQMVALAIHNFTSAAVGIGIAAALVRGIARKSARTIGNFWVDTVRVTYYLLLPVCLVFALALVSQGMIQNFKPHVTARTLDSHAIQIPKTDENGTAVTAANGAPVLVDKVVDTQIIAQGPVASQVAIKMLGTNGGGFFNANAAHPYENPTPFSNFFQMLAIFAIPSALTYYFGRVVNNQKHGWAIWSAMAAMFVVGVLVSWGAEASGNPIHQSLGVAAADGNMEGKEIRFGIFNSALFATITTAASCGAVNAMHDSFTPIGGLVPLFNMQTGEVIFGGVGAGLYGILLFAILAVFIAGLMVGRTPEYLGKKIEAFDVKMAVLVLMALATPLLGFTAWASVSEWGQAGLNNAGPHGFAEILYAFSSAVGNNGSAFAGLTANPANGDPHYNTALGLAMLFGRFLMIVPILAIAGNLAGKKPVPASAGTFKTEGLTFVCLLIGTMLLIGALTYLPALAVGPVAEHFLMGAGRLF
ncbi:potassium-transporting ATPase subunit KdpA [Termitidicoccus mucosus]|uniref:Potassium-transporting ATPase potassium-binding subunit n=1 Tax=Termitidicoccus mucosus TaxID=1184151 RepID=A0A178IEC2_9BACT|nr:potassium-transporting ATPase subunit A [Opitutaceae bacterium TSB47]